MKPTASSPVLPMRVELRMDDYAPYRVVIDTDNLWLLSPTALKKLLTNSRFWLEMHPEALSDLLYGAEKMEPPGVIYKYCEVNRLDFEAVHKRVKRFGYHKSKVIEAIKGFADKYTINA